MGHEASDLTDLRGLTTRPDILTLERLTAIIRLAPIGIGITDRDGRAVLTNDALREMLGYTRAEFERMAFSDYTHPDDVERNDELFARMMTGELERFEIDKRFIHRDGHVIWGRLIVSLLRDEQGVPALSIGLLTDVTEERRLASELEYLAYHDPLTSLANRRLFHDRITHQLHRGLRHPGPLGAILFVDVDDFKLLNDTLGHQAGDDVLVALARRIESVLRPADTAGRLGGDEFGVLLEDIESEEAAVAVADRLVRVLRTPLEVAGRRVVPSVSVGVALLEEDMAADEGIRNADLAMYEAKQRGKCGIVRYRPALREDALQRLDWGTRAWPL